MTMTKLEKLKAELSFRYFLSKERFSNKLCLARSGFFKDPENLSRFNEREKEVVDQEIEAINKLKQEILKETKKCKL